MFIFYTMYVSNYFNVYFLTKYSNLKKKFINFMHQTSVNCERQKRKEAIVTDDYYSNYFRRECKFIFGKYLLEEKISISAKHSIHTP